MRTEQVNLRLEEDILADLERVASAEALDRGTVIRRLLKESIRRWQLERALRGYERGELSIGRAAEEAGISQWELMEAIRRGQVAYPMTGIDVHARLRELVAGPAGPPQHTSGFRKEEVWMGSVVTTLADVPPRPGGMFLIGLNPAPVSVAAGHYYQGRIGRRLWARLARLGLLDNPRPGSEDEAFAAAGHGLTDVVKRPTRAAEEISEEELRIGAELLRAKVRDWRPDLILFPFKRAAIALLGTSRITAGPGPEFEGARTFLLSGPYAPTEEARRIDQALLEHLKTIAGSRNEEAILQAARDRFGSRALQLYMNSVRQSAGSGHFREEAPRHHASPRHVCLPGGILGTGKPSWRPSKTSLI
jgi:double-stranded uracil-DNA glycosylase